jgi:hypothetical protein
MKRPSKLNARQKSEEQEQVARSQEQFESQTVLEFASPEELLRHDSIHTPLPPAIAERLKKSLEGQPVPPSPPWWRRLLGS